jgi:F-type H+-transporting ATPase subunit delta
VSGIAGRYATALFELAVSEKRLDETAAELDRLRVMLEESADLDRLVRSPVVSREDQGRVMDVITEQAGMSPLVRRFVGVVAQNRRLFALRGMIRDFGQLLADHRGEVVAEVTSARSLNDSQLSALKASLAQGLGRDVSVDTHIDENLIGGLVVKVGSRMIDSSLRTKLQNIKFAMKEVG